MEMNFTDNKNILNKLPTNPIVEDYFKLYMTDEIIDYIINQTNIYAVQYMEKESRVI